MVPAHCFPVSGRFSGIIWRNDFFRRKGFPFFRIRFSGKCSVFRKTECGKRTVFRGKM